MRICSAFRKEPRVPETKQEAGAVERGSRKTRLADIFSPSASDRWKLYWISRIKKNRARFRIIRSNSIIGQKQSQGGKLFMPDRSLNSLRPLSNYSHPPVRLYDCYSVEKQNFSTNLYHLKYTYKTRGNNPPKISTIKRLDSFKKK